MYTVYLQCLGKKEILLDNIMQDMPCVNCRLGTALAVRADYLRRHFTTPLDFVQGKLALNINIHKNGKCCVRLACVERAG